MDNLDYDDEEKYLDLQDVAEDFKMNKIIDDYANKIRELIKNLI